jgi:cytosine/adenosine deaminase-related metal-dependent hydrolase
MNNGVGVMRFDTMLKGGVKLALGNDGFSNDMWAEWKAAYLLHKVANRDPRKAGGYDIVQMAALNNARMAENFLGVPIGRLAAGQAADLILLDYHPYTPLTGDNLPWHALFGFESSMCVATLCNGKVLMWDRVLQGIDEAEVMREALAHAPAVWARYRAQVEKAARA